MDTKLSKDVKTHIMLTFSGSKYLLTSQQHEKVLKLGDKDRVVIDGSLIRISTVKEVTALDEYYKDHPDERPTYENYNEDWKKEIKPVSPYTKKKHLRILGGMIKGLQKYIDSKENPTKWSLGQLENLKDKYVLAESQPENTNFKSPLPEAVRTVFGDRG